LKNRKAGLRKYALAQPGFNLSPLRFSNIACERVIGRKRKNRPRFPFRDY
jgi:hypothetical protein